MALLRSVLETLNQDLARAGEIPERFFGELTGAPREQERRLSGLYREQARACFPDYAADVDRSFATDIAQRLNALHRLAKQKIAAGSYGDHKPIAPPYRPTTLTVQGKEITLPGLLGEGLYAQVHTATLPDSTDGQAFLKVARLPRDNDLLEREYRVLRALHQPHPDRALEEWFFQVQRAYIPAPEMSFFVPGEKTEKHRATLYRVVEGRCFTGATLLTEKFPGGMEPRHVWWIFRRLLLTLWMAHLRGYVHGAVTPDHLLVYPDAHGIVLLDWTNASRIGEEPLPAADPAFARFYPPEVWQKEKVTPAVDLFMAAETACALLGADCDGILPPGAISGPLAAALQRCREADPARRPQDAEEFHNEFGRLLGRREYAHMVVP